MYASRSAGPPGNSPFAPTLAVGGVLLGAVLFCALYAALWALGVAHWNGLAPGERLLVPLGVAVAAGFGEELTFRGDVFRVIEDGFGTAVALIVSSVAFGLVHALNPGATIVSTAAIALDAGALLGVAYAATRNLWLPIGLHFGWGFTKAESSARRFRASLSRAVRFRFRDRTF